jgi:nucleoside-diphosphate-sugar epimerase
VTILVVGGTGATGRLLLAELLRRGHHVRAIVRSPDRLPAPLRDDGRLEVVRADLPALSAAGAGRLVEGCAAVASCLGHTISLKGIFGPPRRLVRDATRTLCRAIRAGKPGKPVRYVLMNTTANRNRDLTEPRSLLEEGIFGLLRLALPPQADNEAAADYLRVDIGRDDGAIQWVVVRPDTLTDEDRVTGYQVHPSPTRSPVFNPGRTSRINVGHFMAELLTDDPTWDRWQGRMPVIYNATGAGGGKDAD